MSDAEKFPLDFDVLKKGDIITSDVITDYCGHQPGDPSFNFGALALKALIEKRLGDRGYPVTLSMKGDDLHILTDSEAASYNVEQRDLAERRLIRSQTRLCNVDRSQLTDRERVIFDREVQVGSYLISAVVKTRKKFNHLGGYSNRTPRSLGFMDQQQKPSEG